MVRVTCTALHCTSSSRTHQFPEIKFHQFPHDTKRRKLWLNACNRTDVIDKESSFFKHKYVCSLHFHKCMYTIHGHLRKTAVPSLHFSAKPTHHDSCTQTEEQYVGSYQSIVEPLNQTNSSILNVKKDCTTYTQNEDSLQYNVHAVDVKEEPELSEQDVEMGTENSDGTDDEESEADSSEEGEDIKPDIGETEILAIPQSTQSLHSFDSRYNIDNEESEPFEPDAEIKTEKDDNVDKNCDLEKSEEYEEIKQEISETEIIPFQQSSQFLESVHSLPYHIDHVGTKETITSRIKFEELESCEEEEKEVGETEILPLMPSLQTEDSEMMKETEILCVQSKKSLQEIDQDQTVTIVNRTKRTISINSALIQTDRVIVLNQNLDGTVSVNPDNCTCEKNNRVQMSRAQFYSSCSQFLSPGFCEIVRKQINLDRFKKQVEKKLSSDGKKGSASAGEFDFLPKIKSASTIFTDSAADIAYFPEESTGNLVAKKKRSRVAKNDLLAVKVQAGVPVEANCAPSMQTSEKFSTTTTTFSASTAAGEMTNTPPTIGTKRKL